ncbi:MAG: hypothetical protein ACXVOI_07355, partial [Tumebacillaceae bacterium]
MVGVEEDLSREEEGLPFLFFTFFTPRYGKGAIFIPHLLDNMVLRKKNKLMRWNEYEKSICNDLNRIRIDHERRPGFRGEQ